MAYIGDIDEYDSYTEINPEDFEDDTRGSVVKLTPNHRKLAVKEYPYHFIHSTYIKNGIDIIASGKLCVYGNCDVSLFGEDGEFVGPKKAFHANPAYYRGASPGIYMEVFRLFYDPMDHDSPFRIYYPREYIYESWLDWGFGIGFIFPLEAVLRYPTKFSRNNKEWGKGEKVNLDEYFRSGGRGEVVVRSNSVSIDDCSAFMIGFNEHDYMFLNDKIRSVKIETFGDVIELYRSEILKEDSHFKKHSDPYPSDRPVSSLYYFLETWHGDLPLIYLMVSGYVYYYLIGKVSDRMKKYMLRY